jgi:hypothetical protein
MGGRRYLQKTKKIERRLYLCILISKIPGLVWGGTKRQQPEEK